MAKDYTAIRVSKEARADAQAAKQDGETWDDYVRRCTDVDATENRKQTIDVEDARLLAQHVERSLAPYFADLVGVDDASDVRGELPERFDRIESAALTAEERTNAIQNTLERLQR